MKLTLEQRKRLARQVHLLAVGFMLENTDIPRATALRAALEAANEHGRMLALLLSENGVEVEQL